jgi:hypothetical protein
MTPRLAVDLIRGGGVTGVLRMMLVTFGVAAGVSVACLVAVMPFVLADRADTMNLRTPAVATGADQARFLFSTSVDVWDGQRLGRTFLAGVAPDAPRAPGVRRLPAAGEVVASPALARRLRDGSIPAAMVPGRIVGEISSDGLIEPGELFAYVGVTADSLGDGHPAGSFGSYDALTMARQQDGLTRNLALLVLPPVAAYLVICGRLSMATRLRRYAALRLLGMRRNAVLRLAFAESTVPGIAGALAGVALSGPVSSAIAGHEWLGFSWYAGRTRFGPAAIVCTVALVTVVAGLVGAAGVWRGLQRPLSTRVSGTTEPNPRWWLLAPLVFTLGVTAYFLVALRSPVADGARVGMSGVTAWIGIGTIAVLALSLLMGLRPILTAGGRALENDRLPLALRLAGARLAAQPAATLRLLTGLATLGLVAGVSSGILRDMELRANPADVAFTVEVDGATAAGSAVRQAVFDLPARTKWNVQTSIVDFDSPAPGDGGVVDQARAAGLRLVTMSCARLRDLVRRPIPGCRDGQLYRMETDGLAGSAFTLPPGAAFTFDRGDGTAATLAVPRETVLVPDDAPFPAAAFGALYLAKDGPAFAWSGSSATSFLVDPDPRALTAFKVAAAAVAPTLPLRVWGQDLDLLELSRNQRGIIGFGVLCGFLMSVLAFGVAAVDGAVERRRDVAVLMVLGMRRRTIRAVQVTQLLAALGIVLAAAGLAGFLAGNLAFRLNDVNRPWFAGPLSAMGPFVAASFLVAVVAGSLLAVRRLRSEDLKRE